METASGLCLRICSSNNSELLPAPNPSRRIRSGKSSATLTVLVPMEPVLPRRTTLFICKISPPRHKDTKRKIQGSPVSLLLGGSWIRQNVAQIQIHDRRVEQKAVEQIQNTADAGEKFAGIFHTGFAFEKRFNQIADHGSRA